jgi:hypothetical protein
MMPIGIVCWMERILFFIGKLMLFLFNLMFASFCFDGVLMQDYFLLVIKDAWFSKHQEGKSTLPKCI